MEKMQKEEIKNNPMKKIILVLTIPIILIAMGVIYYVVNQDNAEPIPAPTLTPTVTEIEEEVIANEVIITGREFKFEPSEINIKSGDKVEITFKNNGKMSHDLVFEGTEFKTSLVAGGGSQTIEVVFSKPGEYVFFCSVPGHREAGMEGVLNVQ